MSFKEWKFSSTVIEPMELVGEVFDLKAVAIFFDESGKKYRKRMHVDTKSDVTIIPLSFARLLGLKSEVKAEVNGSEGYLSKVKVRIGEKEFVTTVFCESIGKSHILGVKTLQEFSRIEVDFKDRLLRLHY
jgi:predicted aspartyl protease